MLLTNKKNILPEVLSECTVKKIHKKKKKIMTSDKTNKQTKKVSK